MSYTCPIRWTACLACAALALAVSPAAAKNNRKKSIEIANLNILHGFACDAAGTPGQCRVAERIDLLMDHLVAIGCPDIVTLQENVVNEFVQASTNVVVGPLLSTVDLIEAALPDLAEICGFPYLVVFDPEGATQGGVPRGIDEELILTRYPPVHSETRILYSPLDPFFNRHVLFSRIDHPVGLVDVFTTHLAAGADAANAPCGFAVLPGPPDTPASPVCPASCVGFPDPGFDTVRECQAKQMAAFVEEAHDVSGPAFITGDFNAEPGEEPYNEFVSRGWDDSHLAAGNPECELATGIGCGGGRNEDDLEDPTYRVDERIDYIFVIRPEEGFRCTGTLQTFDEKHGVTSTGIFAGDPVMPVCGPSPLPICWISDHNGNMAALSCQKKSGG